MFPHLKNENILQKLKAKKQLKQNCAIDNLIKAEGIRRTTKDDILSIIQVYSYEKSEGIGIIKKKINARIKSNLKFSLYWIQYNLYDNSSYNNIM